MSLAVIGMFPSLDKFLALSLLAGPLVVSAWYKPPVDTSWAIQYSGTYLDVSNPATVYDIDGFNATSTLITNLHNSGHKVICYFSAGSIENYVPDAKNFPASVQGKVMDGWPDEKWLDVRQISTLKPLMVARAQLAKNKGCDGIDWDNVDGYNNDSGFDLSSDDQLAYNIMLSDITHGLDMAVGLKNDLDQIPALVSHFDFAVNEQCQQYDECDTLLPFIKAGKPVWAISYAGISKTSTCAAPNKLGFMMLLKNLSLDAKGYACWQQLSSTSSSVGNVASTTASNSLKMSTTTSSSKSTTKTSSSSSTFATTSPSASIANGRPAFAIPTSTSSSTRRTTTSTKLTLLTSTVALMKTTSKGFASSSSTTSTSSRKTSTSQATASTTSSIKFGRPAFGKGSGSS